MQSTWGLHVAIIMDGSGRWARERGLPRSAGHRAGEQAVHRVVGAAPGLGIETLTLFAFSGQNWQRPAAEVEELHRVFHDYLLEVAVQAPVSGLRLNIVGRQDRLPDHLRHAIESAEAATANGRNLRLRIAIDYSARDEIVRAACRFAQRHTPTSPGTVFDEAEIAEFSRLLSTEAFPPDVDLLVRTGGEQRLSDFLLWEIAYAELYFTPTMWPDFTAAGLGEALQSFKSRERRFGALPGPAEVRESPARGRRALDDRPR